MAKGFIHASLIGLSLGLAAAAHAQACIGVPVQGENNELALARVKAEAKRANFVEPRGPNKLNARMPRPPAGAPPSLRPVTRCW
jgi:hypothetical protein